MVIGGLLTLQEESLFLMNVVIKKKKKAENRQTAAIANDHFSSDGNGPGSPVCRCQLWMALKHFILHWRTDSLE